MPRKKKSEEVPSIPPEVVTLYNGEVELSFDPVKHVYTANGKVCSGVTTVLKVINKPLLVPWAAKMSAEFIERNLTPGQVLDEVQIKELVKGCKDAHRQKTEKAADVGSMAHKWFEDYVKGDKPATPVNEDLITITDAFLRFFDEYDVEPLRAERKLYSRKMNVAGTTDLICMFRGGLCIADYKTSGSGIYNEAFIQLGAYSAMYAEETGQQSDVHVVINVNKKGECNVGICEEVQRSEDTFRSALSLNRALYQLEQDRKSMIQRIK